MTAQAAAHSFAHPKVTPTARDPWAQDARRANAYAIAVRNAYVAARAARKP